mmetsp:Transcript_32787/g.60053  ORF Transcript_32787/g.60053 Transcript_32787/m.60053 type:complete len:462 (+) Transcript_32787:2062-3447(+)
MYTKSIQAIGSDLKSTEGSTIIDVPRLSVSGLLQLNDLSSVCNLAIGMEKAQIEAEFSSSNWSVSRGNEPHSWIALPFASIPRLELTLRYLGTLVNINDATIACDEFQGSASTTSSQIGKHYMNIVKRRIPFLLSNADIANCNIGDSIGVAAGRVLTNTSVLGATVGIASRDIVGSTLTMGKASRGASSSESYRFGDFSRGVASSVKHAAKSGAEARGDDAYQVGDFTSGTVKGLGNYTSENKCRLAGAGGSALGMGLGSALLGPVGFVAGSMIGGSAAKSSMTALAGADPKKDPQQLEDYQHSSKRSNMSTQRQQQQQQHHHQQQQQQQQHHQQQQQEQQQPDNQVNDVFSSCDTYQVTKGASQHQHTNQLPVRPPMYQTQINRQSGNNSSNHFPHRPHSQANAHTESTTDHQANKIDNSQQGYQFGDITRDIMAKGKKADGRGDNSGYKFGDFTRGLFG